VQRRSISAVSVVVGVPEMKIPLDAAIHLLHEPRHAVLASHSTQLPGYPYATAVPLVVDDYHRPLLLISALAEHTKNLLADPRASLAVCEDGQSSIQSAPRMTLIGNFERFDATPEDVGRYLRYQPEAEHYLQLDFMFFRLTIHRIRFITGIGKMGWLDAEDWNDAKHIALEEESRLLAFSETFAPQVVQLIGLDAYGVDYEIDGSRNRLRFETVLSVKELECCLPERVSTLI